MIETERLILREWREEDAIVMHAIGQDTRVMEFFGPLTDLQAARDLVAGQIVNQAIFGHCLWPVERRFDGRLLGYCGLNPLPISIALDGGIEVGWKLAHDVWGQGYAREAAQACLNWGWANLRVNSIAAITSPANIRSWGLMERLGMTRCPDEDFDHPDLAPGDPLRPHILYRIARPA